jgi:hypothetical protein
MLYLETLGVETMPVTKTGEKVKRAMTKQYGKKKAKQVFHASILQSTRGRPVHLVGTRGVNTKGGSYGKKKHMGFLHRNY